MKYPYEIETSSDSDGWTWAIAVAGLIAIIGMELYFLLT